MSNRILDYPEATAITSDDYILLDNEGTGAKCIKASALNINMDNYTIKEARGAIASFDDGEDLPLAFMGAYITAIQDLHGYDYPWVGGSGKNKFNIATISVKEYIGENGNIYSSNNWSVSDFTSVDSETAYVLSGITNSGSLARHIFYDSNKVFISAINSTVMNFTTPSNAKYIRLSLQSETPTNVQLEKGSTATTFAPYSNICPISGWSAVDVSVVGKNLIPYVELGVLSQTDGSEEASTDNKRTGFIRTLPNTQYTISGLDGSGIAIRIFEYKKDKNYIRNYVSSNITNSVTIQTGAEGGYIRFQGNKNIFTSNVAQCEEDTTATTYEPYNGNTYSLTFTDGTNPLIVYYGTVDLISGLLTINKCGDDMGNMNYTYQSLSGGRNGFSVSVSDMKETTGGSEIIDAISSCYKATNYNGTWANGNMSYFFPTGKTVIFINNDYTDASTFKTAMTGQQFVYPLATPLTYQLSKQQIRSLVGENKIFADTGDSVVDYRKLWLTPEM